MTFRAHLRV